MILSSNRAKKPMDLPSKGRSTLFVYATLMSPKSREHVLHHKEKGKKAQLKDYKKMPLPTPEGKDFNTLVQSKGDILEGDILDISQEDLDKLKKWEDQYFLIPIVLVSGQHAVAFKLKLKDELHKE